MHALSCFAVLAALCFSWVSASPLSNLTIVGPHVSPESFKRAVSAPYVFTAFTAASESNLYVYTSNDGTNFSLLKGPAYTPPTGLIRDPSVILHTDGKYYIAYTTDWTGTNFAIASSTNLQTWSLVATIQTKSSLITPINTWAPEFFKDPKTGKINIIVSLSTGSYGPFLPYAFTATDSTLTKWSGPVVLSGISNAGLGYIDTFPVYYKCVSPSFYLSIPSRRLTSCSNQYHLFTKAESNGQKHIEHATSSSLTGPYTFVQTGDFAGWGQAEGPCVTILPNGKFRLYADGFNSGKYIYSDSSDLHTWSAYQTLPALSGTVRHGTVLKQ
ncbi:arabinosidase [Infundibulicybe gibba]|nr:arabinosidase [Infundibulicybe gibba]